MTWNDIWKMAPVRLSYIIRSMYDLLPSAANLVKWGKINDDKCPLCQKKQMLEHVMSACKVSLAQGRYTWRHNKVLYELADITDTARMKANRKITSNSTNRYFLRAGQPTSHKKPNTEGLPTILDCTNDWEIAVDLAGKGKYPEVIRKYERRPDIVLHSPTSPQIIMIVLTVLYESRLDEQHTYKMEKYYDLVTALRR